MYNVFDQWQASWTTARRKINYKFDQKQAGKAELLHWWVEEYYESIFKCVKNWDSKNKMI